MSLSTPSILLTPKHASHLITFDTYLNTDLNFWIIKYQPDRPYSATDMKIPSPGMHIIMQFSLLVTPMRSLNLLTLTLTWVYRRKFFEQNSPFCHFMKTQVFISQLFKDPTANPSSLNTKPVMDSAPLPLNSFTEPPSLSWVGKWQCKLKQDRSFSSRNCLIRVV